MPYATKADLEEALAASERAWPEWRALDVEKRGAILHKTAALMRERADLIAATMTQEQGKPLNEAKLERWPRPNCSTGMPRTPSAIMAARSSAPPARSAG